ncbi:molybdopterin-dependent oxidoreductase [Photobacterium nomapromontoriensis]
MLCELHHHIPQVKGRRRFYCVNGWSLECEWTGYRLADFLALANPTGKFVKATSLGGYVDTTSIETLLRGDSWLVTHMDGEPLSFKRGQPVRLMVFDLYQFKGVKAIQSLEITDTYEKGTWSTVGYTDATIQPYPHRAIDKNENIMPEAHLLALFEQSQIAGESL